jgi:KDO2-lipid IV(A) lauroyltransferase
VLAFLTYVLYRFVAALTGPLPPRAGYWLARRVGALLYVFSPRLRKVVTHNLRHVLGPEASDAELEAVVRRALVNIAKGHYDLFRVNRLTQEEIRSLVEIEGFPDFLQVLEAGQGAVVVSAHLGNIDIVGQTPLIHGIPITGAVQHIQPERLFRFLLKLRQSHGLRLLPSDGSMLGLFRALKRGEIVALPSDRGFADNVRFVEFFGRPARLPEGAVRIALRTGAPLVPAFVQRRPDDTFLLEVEPPLELSRSGDLEADVADGVKKVADVMERYISRRPEQWLVAVPVWPMEEAQDQAD